ncbi:tRNA (guanine-N(7)-)-methyltransferase [Candidatus Providencia siddallii]|uniref:tRNA (guanine-N(7)-)-methyltransferase n=1 Tax=Candidatus Providencia siddallii TaxID=1715285 RepID=A0A0M6W7T9_9GAMM|nr:tRNA (guanine-N(7)-)-methyltransferase [Candidatus Providencia siddallii]
MIKNNNTSKYDEKYLITHKIRSFVRHQGRITKKQKYALTNQWEGVGIDFIKKPCVFKKIFNNLNMVIMEIGFGMGTSLISTAIKNPEKNFLGIEVYTPGIGSCLSSIKANNIKNLKIIHHDAIEVLDFMIPDNSLSTIQLFFPDPWYKKKHNKRRIVKITFAEKIYSKLIPKGIFHMATDCDQYAKYALNIFSIIKGFNNISNINNHMSNKEIRPETKFEKRGKKLCHNIHDLIFKK